MTSPTRRRFTVSDGMVLVAATAVGIALARILAASRMERFPGEEEPWRTTANCMSAALCLTFCWSFALLVLRLRRPRPGRPQLFRQPGFAASLATVATAAIHGLRALSDSVLCMPYYQPDVPFRTILLHAVLEERYVCMIDNLTLAVAPTVVAVWIVQVMSGACEPEASWLDRSGRALGLFWVAAATGLYPLNWLISLTGR